MTTDRIVWIERMDARKIPPQALEELRRRAVTAVRAGCSQTEVARMFGVSRQTIATWMHAFRHNGEGSLRPRKRGRRPGEQLAIAPDEQLKIVDIIAQHTPDQVGLPYLLWTRAAVGKLIDQELSITLGPATVRNYLIRWGLPMPKPIRASETPHTAIPGGETVSVQWRTTRWSVEGHEPVQEATAFIAVSNRGATYFALHRQPPDSAQLGDRLTRLTDHIGRPTTIITLAWPPNHHDTLQTWIANNLRQVVVVRLAPS